MNINGKFSIVILCSCYMSDSTYSLIGLKMSEAQNSFYHWGPFLTEVIFAVLSGTVKLIQGCQYTGT